MAKQISKTSLLRFYNSLYNHIELGSPISFLSYKKSGPGGMRNNLPEIRARQISL
ncbi:hypothetical protein JCGZ_02255 [Jatropha curcas]|uniref:Uncharacterized protein n=1 Tax=Jatropha curcas TaxID=180498 RepID=A0A067KVW4_JATCU|nr:hypothetical protein JCGZ_02255 [Jatropha curcas]